MTSPSPQMSPLVRQILAKRREEARQLKEMSFIPDSEHPTTDAMTFSIDVSAMLGDISVILTLRRENLLSDIADYILISAFEDKKYLVELDNLQEKGIVLKAPFKPNQFMLNADASVNPKGQCLILQWL